MKTPLENVLNQAVAALIETPLPDERRRELRTQRQNAVNPKLRIRVGLDLVHVLTEYQHPLASILLSAVDEAMKQPPAKTAAPVPIKRYPAHTYNPDVPRVTDARDWVYGIPTRRQQ